MLRRIDRMIGTGCHLRPVRAVALLTLTAILLTVVSAPSAHAAKYAAYVIDAKSGKTLYSRNATAQRFPASLTKMMTLYIIFEMLKQKRLKLDTPLIISDYAASRPPSKLGLKPGQSIRVVDAIRALVTKSANDVATAIAENLGGSEARFAQTMTQTARELGMLKTTFRNASGLPHASQRSTARDMATLGLALIDHHPYYYRYFKTRRFNYRGRSYRNHNSLLYNFTGTDGIKTGYTRASGFNLVASVRRNGRHVIGVVMGGATAGKRNAHMRSILRTALRKSTTVARRRKIGGKGVQLASLKPAPRYGKTRIAQRKRGRQIAALRVPAPRRVKRGYVRKAQPMVVPPSRRIVKVGPVAVLAPKQRQKVRSPIPDYRPSKPRITAEQRMRLASLSVPTPTRKRVGTTFATLTDFGMSAETVRAFMNQEAVMSNEQMQQAELEYARRLQTSQTQSNWESDTGSYAQPVLQPVAVTPSASGTHHVQIGAFQSAAEAEAALQRVKSRADTLLSEFQPVTTTYDARYKRFYRARFAGFDARKAQRTCSALKRRRIDCVVMRAN